MAAKRFRISKNGFASSSGVVLLAQDTSGPDATCFATPHLPWRHSVNFGNGASSLAARVAGTGSGSIAVRLGSTTGKLIGTVKVASTGGYQTWTTVNTAISGASGVSDLYFVFSGSGFNFNWWQFTPSGSSSAPASSSAAGSGENNDVDIPS